MQGMKLLGVALLVSAGLSLTATYADAGTLYRWNDEKGNPVISDRPPEAGIPYTTLNGARYGISPSSSAKAPKPMPTPQAEATKSKADSRPAVAAGEVKIEKHPELCQQAKDNLFKLETFPRIRVTDDDGTVRFMTDEERETQLATAREVAAANCED